MPMIGQASGGFTESSSALRILHVGIRNSVGVLCDDAFTQNNPAVITTQVSAQANTSVKGILGGSVAFIRPDSNGGADVIGGVGSTAVMAAMGASAIFSAGFKAVGVFINEANGNPFENQPGVASGKGAYVSGMGVYGNQLFETLVQITGNNAGVGNTAGNALVYLTGVDLIASRNGFLQPRHVLVGAAIQTLSSATVGETSGAESFVSATAVAANVKVAGAAVADATIGVLKMPADSAQNEMIYDQRI